MASVRRVMDSEDDLDLPGIILLAEARQIVAKPFLRAVQRLEYGDGGRQRRRREAARGADVAEGGSGGHHGECGAGEGEKHEGGAEEGEHVRLTLSRH